MYFNLQALLIIWFVSAVILAGIGAGIGWMTARVMQTQGPHGLWLDAVLGPAVYAVILIATRSDGLGIDWALIGSFGAPIVHQTILRCARN